MATKTKSTPSVDVNKLQNELAINKAMAENSPINIMLADNNLNIIYANPASIRTLKQVERFLPCKAEEVIGKNIDIFHKDPSHQRRILSNERNLPYAAGRADVVRAVAGRLRRS